MTLEIYTHILNDSFGYIVSYKQKDINLRKKEAATMVVRFFLAIGFDLAPLLGTNMVYFREMDFSEGHAAVFLKTLSFGGDTRLKIAVPSPLKA